MFLKECTQCLVTQIPSNFPEYSRRCRQCSEKPTYPELEAKLAKVQEWVKCLNEWEGEFDVDASEIQALKNILGAR